MSGIAAEEMRARAEDVARIAHSTAMEGGGVPEPAMADLAEYVAGDVDEAELIRRGRARFGLDKENPR